MFAFLLSIRRFYSTFQPVETYLTMMSLALLFVAMIYVVQSPLDYQQGLIYKILYIHVPAAALSLACYTGMSVCSVLYLIFRVRILDVYHAAITKIGIALTLSALVTGSIWGKPTWGTWWIWDARLTSEFILLMIFILIALLRQQFSDEKKSAVVISIITLIGFLDLPIIHYSVDWWFTLHQKATVLKLAKPSMPNSMLIPLLMMFLSISMYCLTVFIRFCFRDIERRIEKDELVHKTLMRKKSC